MTALILGPNQSGKSAYAEALAVRLAEGGPLRYLATLLPQGKEGAARVAKHRRQRRGLGFRTMERPRGLAAVPLPAGVTVLLEDASNLLANLIFTPPHLTPGEAVQAALEELHSLKKRSANLVVVSIAGLREGPDYDRATNDYIRALNALNTALAQLADAVVELDAGTPSLRKGELDAPA